MFLYTDFAHDPESSVIDMAWYDKETKILLVQFVETQSCRAYYDVPESVALELLAAMRGWYSTGRAYNSTIKNRYASEAATPEYLEQRIAEAAVEETVTEPEPGPLHEYTIAYKVGDRSFSTRVGAESDNEALNVLFKSFAVVGLDQGDVELVELGRMFS